MRGILAGYSFIVVLVLQKPTLKQWASRVHLEKCVTVLVIEEATTVVKRPRPTDEEIAAKKAAKLAAKPPVLTWRQKFEEKIKELGAESFVDYELDGRILINGSVVFFAHYRNERSGDGWIVRHPETAYLKEGRGITLAYYFPNENEVHAALVVKGYSDNYNRRAGNLEALERLLKGEPKYCLAVEASAVSEFISVMESTEARLKSFLELLAPSTREAALKDLISGLANTHPKNLSHYAVTDALVEAFIQNEAASFLREALVIPEPPTGDFAANDGK